MATAVARPSHSRRVESDRGSRSDVGGRGIAVVNRAAIVGVGDDSPRCGADGGGPPRGVIVTARRAMIGARVDVGAVTSLGVAAGLRRGFRRCEHGDQGEGARGNEEGFRNGCDHRQLRDSPSETEGGGTVFEFFLSIGPTSAIQAL